MQVAHDVPGAAWNRFLDSQPDSSIFQSPALNRVYERSTGFHPFVFASESRDGIKALISGAIVSYTSGVLARLTSRAIVVGGPIGDKSSFPAILDALDRRAEKSAFLTQIRNLRAPTDKSIFESMGYRWEDHLNFIVNLDQSEESLSRSMSKSRQKAIERADRGGLQLVEVRTQQLPSAYNLLRETYSRAGIPLANRSLFENALEVLRESGQLWVLGASLSGTLCAVRFVLHWRTRLFDWYAGSSDTGRAHHANEWLVWQVLRKGIQEGSLEFDFGGGGPPGGSYGPGEFKRRFGGKTVAPGRFVKIYHPLTQRATNTLYKIWKVRHAT